VLCSRSSSTTNASGALSKLCAESLSILRKKNFQLYIDKLREKGGKLDLAPNLDEIKVVHVRRVKTQKSPEKVETTMKAKTNDSQAEKKTAEADKQAEANKQHEKQTIDDVAQLDIPFSDDEGDDALLQEAPIVDEAEDLVAALEAIDVTEDGNHQELDELAELAALEVLG